MIISHITYIYIKYEIIRMVKLVQRTWSLVDSKLRKTLRK